MRRKYSSAVLRDLSIGPYSNTNNKWDESKDREKTPADALHEFEIDNETQEKNFTNEKAGFPSASSEGTKQSKVKK